MSTVQLTHENSPWKEEALPMCAEGEGDKRDE